MVNANEYEPLELSHLHPAAQPVARLPRLQVLSEPAPDLVEDEANERLGA